MSTQSNVSSTTPPDGSSTPTPSTSSPGPSITPPPVSSTSSTSTTSSTTSTSSSIPIPPSTSSTSSSTPITSSSSSSSAETTSSSSSSSSSSALSTSTHTVTTTGPDGSTTTVTTTSTTTPPPAGSSSGPPAAATSADSPLLGEGSSGNVTSGLSPNGRIAVAVVVPIVGVALLVLAGLFFWRRRKQRKDAEELRRKEVEEYGYNPNDDPSLPPVGGVTGGTSSDGAYELREDGQGYRGWGTTTGGASSGRKGSTTLSNAPTAMAYSEGTSPTHDRSGEPLMGTSGRPLSADSGVLGAMGPAAGGNRSGEVHRGPSNASSSYSVANRSDASGEAGIPGGAYGAAQYYSTDNNYGGGYSGEGQYGSPPGRAEMGGQPVIRDNLARRATRIENPSHFPTQASAGISQNF